MASARRERGKRTWELVWDEGRDPETGRRRQRSKRGFPTKRAALQWYSEMQELDRQRTSGGNPSDTVEHAVRQFLSRHPVTESSQYAYQNRARLYIYPYVGSVPLRDLGPDHIHDWLHTLQAQGLSTGTISKAHNLLSSALSNAIDRGIITANACKLVKAPPIQTRQMRIWNDQQIRQFLRLADQDHFGLIYRLMLFSQIRPGEAVALKWSDIDWKRGTITVARTRKRKMSGGFRIGDTVKTPAGHDANPHSQRPGCQERQPGPREEHTPPTQAMMTLTGYGVTSSQIRPDRAQPAGPLPAPGRTPRRHQSPRRASR